MKYDVHYFTEIRIDFKNVEADSHKEAFDKINDQFDFHQLNYKSPGFNLPDGVESVASVEWTEGVATGALIYGPNGEILLDEDGETPIEGQLKKDVFEQRIRDINLFFEEIEKIGGLEKIERIFGYEVIIEMMRFQQAIASGEDLKKSTDELFIEVLNRMPSADKWKSMVQRKKRRP